MYGKRTSHKKPIEVRNPYLAYKNQPRYMLYTSRDSLATLVAQRGQAHETCRAKKEPCDTCRAKRGSARHLPHKEGKRTKLVARRRSHATLVAQKLNLDIQKILKHSSRYGIRTSRKKPIEVRKTYLAYKSQPRYMPYSSRHNTYPFNNAVHSLV